MTWRLVIPAIVLVAACGQAPSKLCVLPAAVPGDEDPANSCRATIHLQICDSDGAGARSCHEACAAGQYALSCVGAAPKERDWLYCNELDTPTGVANERVFCCTC